MKEDSENLVLVFMIHRTHDMLRRCEDRVFGEHGLTAEQHSVLSAVKYLDEPVKVTDVAHRLTRSVNSVSMIIDRMVKTGLVERTRDEKDRRTVHLVITNKAEVLSRAATLANQRFTQKVLSPVSDGDRQFLIRLLETLQHEASEYLGLREPASVGNRS